MVNKKTARTMGIILTLSTASLGVAQQKGAVNKPDVVTKKEASSKLDAASKKALAYFANAADYQNGGAFELAADEWERLVKEFPTAPQASTAWHHLGICNLQRKEPNYQRAIEAFRESLKDNKLELREETLINLSWALFSQARRRDLADATRVTELEEARERLGEFLKEYPDGAYLDQAMFYLGDIEHLLGNRKKAIAYFKRFLETEKLNKSSLRPDTLYALAVAYHEEENGSEASRRYREFLSNYGQHKLSDEVRIRSAELALAADKLSEAEVLLKQVQVTQSAPLGDLALLRLGYIYGKQGKNIEAAATYDKLVQQYPDSSYARKASLAYGQLKLQENDLDLAQAAFRKAAAGQDSVATDAAHWIAVTLLRQGNAAQAAKHAEDWLRRVPDSSVLRLDYADALYAQNGKRDEARRAYEALARDLPDSAEAPRAAYNAAFAALELGDALAAQQWSERFLAKYPSDGLRAEVAYVAAESLLRQGMHDAAARAYNKLIDSDRQNERVNHWKLRQGMAYYLSGKYDQAAENMRKLADSLQDNQEKAEAKFIAGASLLYLEKADQAVLFLEDSHRLSNNWTSADETLMVLGEAYQRLKNNAKAKQAYNNLLQSFPNSRLKSQVKYKLAQMSAAEGQLAEAIDQYRQLIADPAASGFHHFSQYGIVWCLMQQNQHAAAHQELQPLLAKNLPDTIGNEALLADGICLRKMGQTEKAAKSLRKFLDRNPQGVSLGNGLYELGLVLTELQQLDQANQQYERLLTDVPGYSAADRVLYELAWNLLDLDKSEDAANRLKELVTRHPQSVHVAEANYLIGQQLYDAQQYAEALKVYSKILDQSQDSELLEKTLYKLGWSHFQLQQFPKAIQQFQAQTERFSKGKLAVDGLFMLAECSFKQEQFATALISFQAAKAQLEATGGSAASPQVQALIYLHGGQCLRELKRWDEAEKWFSALIQKYPENAYLPTAIYELGYCKQNQGKLNEAVVHYSEVATGYRTEVAAKARFMLGEMYFSQKDFAKAIPEFQRVMYGFGGDKASEDIKNWQAKSAFEAARCSEVLISNLSGAARKKVVDTAIEFYEFVVQKHAKHELAAQAQNRLGELQKLR